MTLFWCIIIGTIVIAIIYSIVEDSILDKKIEAIKNQNYIENAKNKLLNNNFTIDKTYYIDKLYSNTKNVQAFAVCFDNKNKQIAFINADVNFCYVFGYDKIKNFDLIKNSVSEISSNSDKALLGGFLFGTTGAIIGASAKQKIEEKIQSLQLVVRINDFQTPEIRFEILLKKIDTQLCGKFNENINHISTLFSQLQYVINHQKEEEGSL